VLELMRCERPWSIKLVSIRCNVLGVQKRRGM
jgi:hypothetical protein